MSYRKIFLALLGVLPGLTFADTSTVVGSKEVAKGISSAQVTLTAEEKARLATQSIITFRGKRITPGPELTNLALQVRERVQLTAEEHNWLETRPWVHVRVGDYPPFHFVTDAVLQGLGIDYMHTIYLVYSLNCDYVSGLNIAQSMRSMTEPDGIAVQTAWQQNAEREWVAISNNERP